MFANAKEIENPSLTIHAAVTQRLTTHLVLGLLVGPGIRQHAHTVHLTHASGINQRRPTVLRGLSRQEPPHKHIPNHTQQQHYEHKFNIVYEMHMHVKSHGIRRFASMVRISKAQCESDSESDRWVKQKIQAR